MKIMMIVLLLLTLGSTAFAGGRVDYTGTDVPRPLPSKSLN
jgi:hypothetical protein